MSYDFFVFPPDLAADSAAAEALMLASGASNRRDPGSPIDECLRSLEELDASATGRGEGFLSINPLEATDRCAYVPTTFADPGQHLLVVASAAARHGLSTFDPQTSRLYDPTDACAVDVEAEQGLRLDWLSPQVLRGCLADIEAGQGHFLIVSSPTDEQTYAQVYGEDGHWDVEFRDGSADRHYAAETGDRPSVERFLWDWVVGDPAWRTAFDFRQMRL